MGLRISITDYARVLLRGTLAEGHDADLKIDVSEHRGGTAYRVWITRMTDADALEYFTHGHRVPAVQVERLEDGRWLPGTQDDLDRALALAD